MTLTELCTAIEADTRGLIWKEAALNLRVLTLERAIQNFIDQSSAEPEEAAKKVTKVRKVRKPKAAPLTQHAGLGAGLEGSE